MVAQTFTPEGSSRWSWAKETLSQKPRVYRIELKKKKALLYKPENLNLIPRT